MQPSAPPTVAKPHSWITLLVGGVVAILIIATFVGLGIPALQRTIAQPNVFLEGVNVANNRGDCDAFFFPGPPQYFRFSFTIRNIGDADAFVTIAFIVGAKYETTEYFVAAHDSGTVSHTVRIDDCGDYTWDLRIESVQKP